MDDKFLHELRKDPDPAFEARLRERLQAIPPPAPAESTWRWRPAVAATAALTAVIALFAFPTVRASAQAFLDFFRVRQFTAVHVDPTRLEQLGSESLGLEGMLTDHVRTLEEPGPAVSVASPEAAAGNVGFKVRVPSFLPRGLERDSMKTRGQGRAELTADAAKLRHVLDVLGIDGVTIPANLDGARVMVRMPAAVEMHFASDSREVRFLQSESPEVRLPPAMDLEDLGEIGLRIVGLSKGEARRLARSIDWHTTLLVPVPASVRSFHDVTVHGQRALLVEATDGTAEIPGGRRGGRVVMWSENGMVYALAGNIDEVDLLEMANSVR
jgi:hypothetical protein